MDADLIALQLSSLEHSGFSTHFSYSLASIHSISISVPVLVAMVIEFLEFCEQQKKGAICVGITMA